MSFSSLHQPKLSLTSSFGSSLNLAEYLDGHRRSESEDFQRLVRSLSSKKQQQQKEQQHQYQQQQEDRQQQKEQQQRHPLKQVSLSPVPHKKQPKTEEQKYDEETPLLSKEEPTSNQNQKEAIPELDTLSQQPTLTALTPTLLLTITIVTLGSSFQFGYGTGVMNNSKAFITEYFHNQNKSYTLIQWGTVVSSYGIGGLLGSIVGPMVLGQFFGLGRRDTLLVNNLFLGLSSYFFIFAREWWWQAIGRVFVGIVAGIATAVVPTYLSELSPIAIRGAVGTLHQLGITLGIVLSQYLSTPSLHLLGSVDRWQWLFVVPLGLGVVQCVILPFCPESPSYLYQTKGKEKARESLKRIQREEEVIEAYLNLIQEEIKATSVTSSSQPDTNGSDAANAANGEKATQSSQGALSTYELFHSPTLRKQLIVGIAVQLMMQFSGIDAVFYYSTTIFYQAEVSDPELATTLLGIVNVAVTIGAVKYMDEMGRKKLLTVSWVGLLASYLVLTGSFVCKPYFNYMDQISIAATTGVIIFFAFGPGCIAWFIIAEIFPLHARDTAMAVGIFINWAANWFVAFTFPQLLEYTQPYTFLVFVGTAAFFLWFTVRFVPETKGLTVAQVTKEFDVMPVPNLCPCLG